MVEHAAHFLPAQGPIGVFIHHNTLHAFQHKTFEDAVVEAGRMFGAEPYLLLADYHAHVASGRITQADIDAVIAAEPAADRELCRQLVLAPPPITDAETLQWRLEEGDLAKLLAEARGAALFARCLSRTPDPAEPAPAAVYPERELVNEWMIRLCGAYLDQGMSYWPMARDEAGFLASVAAFFSQPGGVYPTELHGVREAFLNTSSAEIVIESSLRKLAVAEPDWEDAVRDELLALPGWAGMFHKLELEPELAPHDRIPCTLADYLAVRYTLVVLARPRMRGAAVVSNRAVQHRMRAANIFIAAHHMQLTASSVDGWTDAAWEAFVDAVEEFGDLERRRLLHLAYERHHEQEILHGVAAHVEAGLAPPPRSPTAQVFFCIDEREESIRRALEEVAPDVETLGAAGFFGFAIDYQGIDDAHGVSLCPIVVKPQHAIREKVSDGHEHTHRARAERRKQWARAARGLFVGSRTLFRGMFSTVVLGIFSVFPLVVWLLAPRRYGQLRNWLNALFLPEPRTELLFTREGDEAIDGFLAGFALEEKADRVAGMLINAGLTKDFARLVVVLGHGSTSLNNPHESAYDCGACGGRRGGPNGRLFAAMANHPRVRELLRERGLPIPDTTWFVGGCHDTCSDVVELYDTFKVPETHAEDLARIITQLDQARTRNAHERSRRFESCHNDTEPVVALQHVEARSEHLAEPRPEYGHSSNSVCVVGRRTLTRGLFFDRRAFLVSYDAASDANDDALARQLGAVVPVCGGISLEYFFSFVDNERYGCGTKLPHNVTGLIGVVNGHASDLRTGLTLQMVEIHEPVRILFLIESTPERLEKVIQADATLREFVVNRWVRISTIDPDSRQIYVRRDHGYEPLTGAHAKLGEAQSSIAWYQRKIEHLPMARIGFERAAVNG